jgi:molybdopterin molybdotransferase
MIESEKNQGYSVEFSLNEYLKVISEEKLTYEYINVEDGLSRILFEDIYVNADYPRFDKAVVDGFAIKSYDVMLADYNNPVTLKLVGEADVGDNKRIIISDKEAVKISKGAFMPENANAVVLPEDTICEEDTLKVFRSVISDNWTAKKGEDLKSKDIFILKKRKLRPQDIGGLISIGYRQIKVFKKPVVSIIPTGNELVPPDVEPDDYQIISSNGYVLKGFVEQLGGVARISSIVKDDLNQVRSAIVKALEVSDLVLVSGGSAIGTRDYTLQAIKNIQGSNVIIHGVAMRPGDHVLLTTINEIPVIGLPGHPVSNMTCFHVFGKPVLKKLAGNPRSFWQEKKDTITISASLARNIRSPEGKEDYVRVRLRQLDNGRIIAFPYTGKSSFISTLVKSHGIIKIPAECSSLYEGDMVEVFLF